ncbi:MAG: reductive dehalogenase domain-containing protein [Bacillota bacterium]|jgi:epoxyqueuosine reductase|nr:reductive dehalogenase domain-containing protein [Bacillota bacterium]
MPDLTDRIIDFARSKGADLVGIADADSFLIQDEQNKFCPRFYLPEAKSVIVIGLKLVDSIWDRLTGNYDPYSTNLHSYLMHYNYDQLDFISCQVARFLEDIGYDGYPIEARTETKSGKVFVGLFPFKEAAVLAGMGRIGKSSLLITPEFGPRVRLTAVITDAPLDTTIEAEPGTVEDVCNSCTLCIDQCPAGAISYDKEKKVTVIDKEMCQARMDWAQCALCQGVCILGHKAAKKRRERKTNIYYMGF